MNKYLEYVLFNIGIFLFFLFIMKYNRDYKDNNTIAPYSTGYINSLRFKIYSKSSGDVNLRLTGEMMASLNPVDSPNTVVIEVLGENNKAKADGHITGRRGKSVTRDFLGLPEDVEVNLFKDTLKKYRQGSLYLLSDILT